MSTPIRILYLEENTAEIERVRSHLAKDGIAALVDCVQTLRQFTDSLERGGYSLILSDYSLPSADGLSALTEARRRAPGVPFIFVAGPIGEVLAVEAVQRGAADLVLKNDFSRLTSAVERALKTSRKRTSARTAKGAIDEDERFAARLVATLPTLVYLTDVIEKRTRFINERMAAVLNYTRREIEGGEADLLTRLLHPEDRARMQEHHEVLSLAPRGTVREIDFRLRHRTNSWILFHSEETVFERTKSGRARLVLGIATVITRADGADEKLRKIEAWLESAYDAIVVLDLDGGISYWNKGAERLYGWSAEEVTGRRMSDFLVRRGRFRDLIEALRTTTHQGEWAGELHQLTRDGIDVIVESHWSLVRDDRLEPNSILTISSNISHRKQLQEQVLRAQRLESIGTLAGGIAHDLNNVLGPILIGIEMLRRRVTDPAMQKLLVTIESNTRRGAEMIRQVLTFARGASGEPILIQPRHLLSEIMAIAHQTFPKSITLKEKVSKELWTILGDPTQIHQTIMNLLINARDAMPRGGTLTLIAENLHLGSDDVRKHSNMKEGPYVCFRVVDTGGGIPPEILPQIFDPFFTTKEIGKGTGLGLSTALGIVKNLGGCIEVESRVGEGSTFSVYLPASESLPQRERASTPAPPRGNNELILVVDDEIAVNEMIKETLESHGYRVLTALDGVQGISLYADRLDEIDLVITDLMMPHLDGAATIQALFEMNPQVKIIAVSGLVEKNFLEGIANHEKISFLSKPFPVDALLSLTAQVLGVLPTSDRTPLSDGSPAS